MDEYVQCIAGHVIKHEPPYARILAIKHKPSYVTGMVCSFHACIIRARALHATVAVDPLRDPHALNISASNRCALFAIVAMARLCVGMEDSDSETKLVPMDGHVVSSCGAVNRVRFPL